MGSSNYYVLDLTIEIAVAIPASAKRRSNVILTLGQRRKQLYNIQPKERQVNVLTGGPLNVFPFEKQIKVHLKYKSLMGTSFISLIFEV